MLAELHSPTSPPIVTAIVGQSIVEHILEKMLRPRFSRSDDDTWKAITGENGPLNTFSQKIVAGYAFRLYGADLQTNLNIIRNVRNAFAHSKKPVAFSHPLVLREMSKMVPVAGKRRSVGFFWHEAQLNLGKDARQAYGHLCAMAYAALAQTYIKRLSASLRARQKRESNALIKELLASGGGLLGADPLAKG